MPAPRTRAAVLVTVAAVAAALAGTTATATAGPASADVVSSTDSLRQTHLGLDRLLAEGALGADGGRGIVRLDGIPSAADVAGLEALGLTVQPMHRLPLALVRGTTSQLVSAVTSGIGLDVYPDEQLTYLDTASSDVTSSSPAAAAALRKQGLTGKGVTVGIIDSGCDGTHPDLADRIVHNVTLVSPEYVNAGTEPTLVVPVDQGPYNNTDLGSGHGTHVAGIIAADGTTGPDHLGVAPDAELACFAIGAVITTTAVVTAFDYILDQPDQLGIDVVNNSWGNSFRQYDPADPVNIATKAISKKGIVTVFAAGNSGSGLAEGSVSPFNQAPWVISVAAGDLDRVRGDFSSNGLEFDNGKAAPIGKGGHTVFTGDRIGNTQPDVMAPGVDISSTCDSTGSVIGPCPGSADNATASGTSMASPHIAGVAAVLKQANPRLTYTQVEEAMTATASPVRDPETKKVLPSHLAGYGYVNLDKAVALVRSNGWAKRLDAAQQKADARLAAQDAWKVVRTDLWQGAAPVVSFGGSYNRTFPVTVTKGVSALKIALVYPTPGTAANLASFTGVVKDAKGKVVGTTETDISFSTGITSVLVKGVKAGAYSVEVTGDYAVSDPDTVDSDSVNGRVVFLQAAQLAARRRG